MYKRLIVAAIVMTFILVCTAYGSGTIQGKVVSSDTGETMANASITVEGTELEATTDIDGIYKIENVPAGQYRIEASKEGYAKSVITDVEVKDDETTDLDIALSASSEAIQLGTVEVTAKRSMSTVAGLISSQRKAPTIGASISSEEIRRTPDSDAADVLKRVTGLSVVSDKFVYVRGLSERYSNTQLNKSAISTPEADKWVIPLDIFPAGVLDNIVVTKTFSPDMPGDFAGGSIQLSTKDFPEEFTAKLSASFGYESGATFEDVLKYEGGSLDFLGFDDGTRALPDIVEEAAQDKLVVEGGIFGGGFTAEELEEFGESFSNIWEPTKETALPTQSYSFSIGDQVELNDSPFGYVASLLYKNGHSVQEQNQSYYIRGAGGQLEKRHDYQDIISSKAKTALGGILNFSWKPTGIDKVAWKTTFNHTSEDEVYTYNIFPNRDRGMDQTSTTLRWVQRTILSTQLSGERQLPVFSAILDWRANYSLAMRHEPDTRDTLFESEIDQNDFRLADETNSGNRFFSDLLDNNFDLGLDITIPFEQWSSLPSKLKFGGNFTIKDREIDSRRFRFKPKDYSDIDLHQLAEEIFTEENISPDGFQLEEDTRPTDNYSAQQIIDGAYLMVDMPIMDKLRFAGGARVEFSQQEVETFDLFNPSSEPIVGLVEGTDIMPSANFTYSLTENMNLRLGASQTVSRPSFRELSEFEFTDIGGHAIVGNPDLKRALIQNYDLRWELYSGVAEYVTFAVFYKHFKNPIERTVKITSAELTSSWENAKTAYSYRAEMEIRRNFGFVSPALSGFTLTGNIAVIESKVELQGSGSETSTERPLQGQSPYVVNIMASYRIPKIYTGFSVLYNVFGERITEVGVFGTPDIYEQPFNRVDLVLTQPIGDSFSIKFSAKNLLDPEAEFIQGDEIQRVYKNGRSYSLGVSYSW
ncbi:TonB-dependent receptor [Candidatus Poribacteria bacterium]|nr:TonB-dependent receptor [Candidatus Poribacteria bacterium]